MTCAVGIEFDDRVYIAADSGAWNHDDVIPLHQETAKVKRWVSGIVFAGAGDLGAMQALEALLEAYASAIRDAEDRPAILSRLLRMEWSRWFKDSEGQAEALLGVGRRLYHLDSSGGVCRSATGMMGIGQCAYALGALELWRAYRDRLASGVGRALKDALAVQAAMSSACRPPVTIVATAPPAAEAAA